MAKKVQLSDLNLNSFIVKLDKQEAKTAVGGRKAFDFGAFEERISKIDFGNFKKGPFTEHKSQRAFGNGFTIKNRRR